jgi:O-antigen/teichoic acid export membrane protein
VRLSFWVLTTLGIPIGLWLLFGAPDIVRILYGPQWGESAVFLRFLTIYSFLWPLVNVGFWLSVAKAHTRTMMVITMSQAAMLIVLGTPLTIQWGAIGTIVAVIATMILAFTLSSIYVFRQVDLSFIETYSAPFIALLCALFVLAFATQATALNTAGPFLRLAVIGVLGPGVFWLSLFLLRPKETVERVQYLRRVWRKN